MSTEEDTVVQTAGLLLLIGYLILCGGFAAAAYSAFGAIGLVISSGIILIATGLILALAQGLRSRHSRPRSDQASRTQ